MTCLAVATFQLRALFLAEPIYRQDWAWPVLLGQLTAAGYVNSAPWNSDGLGAASIAPLNHPMFFAWSWLGTLFGPQPALALSMVAAFALLGLGVASCVRRLWAAPEHVALLTGLLAQLGPPLMNKIVAGHAYYVISLAAFAWFARSLAGGYRRPELAFLAAGLLAGFAILQIQLYAIMVIVLIAAAILKKNLSFAVRIVAVFVAVSQVAPELYAAMGRDAPAAYAWMKPRLMWEMNNSAPFPDGMYMLGYAPRYAENALRTAGTYIAAIVALQVGIALGLAAAIVRRKATATIPLLAGWILCTLLVLGLNGPLAAPLSEAFEHIAAFGVFRELYHFAGPAWVLEMLLVGGVAFGAASRRLLSAYLAIAVAIVGSMWVPSNFAGQIARAAPPQTMLRALNAIAHTTGASRFLLWPAEWPVGPTGTLSYGNDPFAYPIGNHPVANEFRLSGPLEVAASLVREGRDHDALRWFAAAGVGTIVDEPWLSERLLQRAPPFQGTRSWIAPLISRALRRTRPPSLSEQVCLFCTYPYLPTVPEPEDWSGGDAFVVQRDLHWRALSGCRPASRFAATDPGSRWVGLENWSWLDSRLAMLGAGVMTWGSGPLRTPACGGRARAAHVLLLSGRLYVDGRRRRVVEGRPTWIALTPGSHLLSVKDGLLAVDELARALPMPGSKVVSAGPAGKSLSFDWRTGRGSGRLPRGTRWVVLKTTFSPHWQLQLGRGGRVLGHVVVSGYANAWKVQAEAGTEVTVWYDRWRLARFLSEGALWVWLLSALYSAAAAVRGEAERAVA